MRRRIVGSRSALPPTGMRPANYAVATSTPMTTVEISAGIHSPGDPPAVRPIQSVGPAPVLQRPAVTPTVPRHAPCLPFRPETPQFTRRLSPLEPVWAATRGVPSSRTGLPCSVARSEPAGSVHKAGFNTKLRPKDRTVIQINPACLARPPGTSQDWRSHVRVK